jgi:hypothetical protein
MNIEKLKKQQEAIAAQIVQAEMVEKNKARVQKMVMKLLEKHPGFFTADAKKLEAHLITSFAAVAEKLNEA